MFLAVLFDSIISIGRCRCGKVCRRGLQASGSVSEIGVVLYHHHQGHSCVHFRLHYRPLIQSIQAKPGTQPLSSIKNASDMTAESQWIQLYEPVGVVSSDNGNWRHLSHLSNGKNFFKECMNPRFKAIVQILRDHGVGCVNCSICDSSMYVME